MFTQPLSRPGREGFQRYSAEDVYVEWAYFKQAIWLVWSSDICGGSLNTIWAGGALRDMEVEVTCGKVKVKSKSEMSTDHLFVCE